MRRQIAITRAVLEELDRILPAEAVDLDAQLLDELRRLALLLLEVGQPTALPAAVAPRSGPMLRASRQAAGTVAPLRAEGRP